MHGMGLGDMPDTYNVVVNTNHPLVAQKLVGRIMSNSASTWHSTSTSWHCCSTGCCAGKR